MSRFASKASISASVRRLLFDCPIPLFGASASVYTAAMAMGLAEHDTAATAEVLAALSGRPKVQR